MEPCKTFAEAISRTVPGGYVSVLDPGDFGAVTITKSITISSEGFEAGVLVSGTNGIIVSAPNNANVVLRGLEIDGLGTGLSGIKVLSAGSVHVEKCTINNFTQSGIEFVPSSASATTSELHVSDTIARNNVGAAGFAAIHIKPGANVTAIGSVENTVLKNNSAGLRVEDNSTITAKNTTASGNSGAGLIAISVSVGGAANLNLDKCVASSNGFGIRADGANATTRFANCMTAGNTTAGVSSNAGGKAISFTGTNSTAGSGISSANSDKTISFTGTNFFSDTITITGPNIAPQ